jgi:poly(3-hydroxybutyrate) depolymerase
MAGSCFARFAPLIAALLAAGAAAQSRDTHTVAQVVTPRELIPAAQAASLANTLDPDRRITYHVRVPPGAAPHGVLVFVSPRDDAEPREGWAEVLDRRNLVWIAAEGFGNDRRSAQRVLVALLALKQLQRMLPLDRDRLYIGGMSGGGRVASQALARFPGFFSGALCIVGADYVTPESQLQPEMATKRVVFMTGDGDFNRREIRRVYLRYLDAGVSQSHLIDLQDFDHQYPDADQLDEALELLDQPLPR